MAHIGVIKALEEANIPIDYIAGTSMGAVIGGMYASGYNATQIDSIFQKTNFDALVNDEIPRTSKNFYEKKNDELYALSLPFNNFKVGIPISLSLVYLEIGRRLGRDVRGISLPGHFLVEFRQGGFSVYLDPYHGGRFLTREDCIQVAAQAAGVGLTAGDAVFDGASKRQILLRMLNNLRGIYLEKRDLDRALTVVDLLVTGDRQTGAWYKQRAAIRIDLGDWDRAASDLERYLELAPFAVDRAQVEHYVARLKKA